MAKNIKIIPSSGSLEFDDNGTKVIYTIDSASVTVNNELGSKGEFYKLEGGETPRVNIDNNINFITIINIKVH